MDGHYFDCGNRKMDKWINSFDEQATTFWRTQSAGQTYIADNSFMFNQKSLLAGS